MAEDYGGIEIVGLPDGPEPKPKNRRIKYGVDKHPMDEERAGRSKKERRKHKPVYKNIKQQGD